MARILVAFFIMASVLFQSGSMLFLKQAGNASRSRGLLMLVANPWYLGSLACLVLQSFCWILVLRRIPISAAYPCMSLVLPVNLFFAHYLFREHVSMQHLLGTMIILIGIIIRMNPKASS